MIGYVSAVALFIAAAAHARPDGFYPSQDTTYTGASSRIVNGEPAEKGAWPWQLSLEYWNPDLGEWRHTCGASVLSENWALTAAHCVDGRWPDLTFRVVVGQSVRGENTDREQAINVTQAIMHENYDDGTGSFANDVAVLLLEEDIVYNEFVRPAILADPAQDTDFESAECWATGWGKENGRDNDIPDTLNQAAVSVLSRDDCRARMPLTLRPGMMDSHVCIFDERDVGDAEKRGICQGDSGGPVNCVLDGETYVLGAASFVVGGIVSTCDPAYPGVYARASSYREWISDKTGISY